MNPIPGFEERFNTVLIQYESRLPKTKPGNQYVLKNICNSTHFPEAIPRRNIKSKNIIKALNKLFSLIGIPSALQSEIGSNFMYG